MALGNCKSCGRLFNIIHRDICPVCVKDEEEKFYIIRNFLKENRGATTYEVQEATGIDLKLIIKFVREGRLSTLNTPNLTYPCESCGEGITEGRFCKPCKDRLTKGLETTKEELRLNSQAGNDHVAYHNKRLR
ncbi:MAG: TIGR03826 family flagellar region protein [Tumebacillaceae bacterium]